MCKYIKSIDTKTKFIILMHQKEFRKTKNGTGHFTNLSLNNCELYVGINFSNHKRINEILQDNTNNCYVLFPSKDSINLSTHKLNNDFDKTNVVFIIDSTWACAKSILFDSTNINKLPKISFSHTKKSAFKIKEQPEEYCLSTIESTLCVLELLEQRDFDDFLQPFEKMVEYQISCASDIYNKSIRYKIPYTK
jgi:DTW domain-containing protein YfiP